MSPSMYCFFCSQEEIFGPVVCVAKFSGEDEAVSRANDSKYGLCASVWTESAGRQHRVSKVSQPLY